MRKKIGALALSVCIGLSTLGAFATTAFAQHQCSQTITIGDVNLDGVVDSLDLAVLLQEINGTVTFNKLQNIAADVNNDAGITMLDYNMLRDYLLRITTSFPAGAQYTIFYGDLDGDQLVTTADKTILSNFILRVTNITAKQYVAADVNGDGTVDSIDLLFVQHYLNGQRDHFPVCPQQ